MIVEAPVAEGLPELEQFDGVTAGAMRQHAVIGRQTVGCLPPGSFAVADLDRGTMPFGERARATPSGSGPKAFRLDLGIAAKARPWHG